MDSNFSKSLLYSLLAHLLVFFLMLLINFNITTKEEDIYREVSFVVERDFPEMQEDQQSSLAQQQKVKDEPVHNKVPPQPKEKVDEFKSPAGKTKPVELAPVKAKQPEPVVPESFEQTKKESVSKVFIPQQRVDATKESIATITKDIPGGDFGESVADIRPSKNLEIFGPIVNRSIVYSEIPDYPDWARVRGIEAEVRMKFWVESSGEVANIDVTQKSGYLELDLLAKNSLAKWKFTPLEKNVPQIKQWGEIVVRFVLY